jgi:radical SAM protein with 4Fe4S-binding SPASM domain
MLNPEGLLTACYLETERWTSRGIDPVIGRVDPVSGVMIDLQKLDTIAGLLETKPRCNRCFCRYTCAGGCHIEQTPPGCSLEYDNRCRATRLITAGRLLRNLDIEAAELFTMQTSMMRKLADSPDDRLAAWILGEKQVRE